MKKARIGKRIRTLAQLRTAAMERRSVLIRTRYGFQRHPAAFAMNYTGSILLALMNEGMFLYKAVKPIDPNAPARAYQPKKLPPPPILRLPYYPEGGGA